MHITDMAPSDFVEALAQIEVATVRSKDGFVAVDKTVAHELVRLATALIRTEIEMKKFNEGFGYKKANDPWAVAMEAAEAV
jgi:hypothetical protein